MSFYEKIKKKKTERENIFARVKKQKKKNLRWFPFDYIHNIYTFHLKSVLLLFYFTCDFQKPHAEATSLLYTKKKTIVGHCSPAVVIKSLWFQTPLHTFDPTRFWERNLVKAKNVKKKIIFLRIARALYTRVRTLCVQKSVSLSAKGRARHRSVVFVARGGGVSRFPALSNRKKFAFFFFFFFF